MPCCRVCGEIKPDEDFHNIANFTKYKKHKVIWCKVCQKLWVDMKKEKERIEKFRNYEAQYSVSFS